MHRNQRLLPNSTSPCPTVMQTWIELSTRHQTNTSNLTLLEPAAPQQLFQVRRPRRVHQLSQVVQPDYPPLPHPCTRGLNQPSYYLRFFLDGLLRCCGARDCKLFVIDMDTYPDLLSKSGRRLFCMCDQLGFILRIHPISGILPSVTVLCTLRVHFPLCLNAIVAVSSSLIVNAPVPTQLSFIICT